MLSSPNLLLEERWWIFSTHSNLGHSETMSISKTRKDERESFIVVQIFTQKHSSGRTGCKFCTKQTHTHTCTQKNAHTHTDWLLLSRNGNTHTFHLCRITVCACDCGNEVTRKIKQIFKFLIRAVRNHLPCLVKMFTHRQVSLSREGLRFCWHFVYFYARMSSNMPQLGMIYLLWLFKGFHDMTLLLRTSSCS